ncbi:hypothetical protein SEPCBS57363_004703 [Sporothrix epigloea]|uniref:UBR-type domain-containing protein n=1 Tax=Sporothrix epigloea TaxID=1892477 RepID=A0ABP0DTG7_9PEZI
MDSKLPGGSSAVGDTASQDQQPAPPARRNSSSQDSQASDGSHTALDFIRSQMQLEADAREAMPYSIEHCSKPLGRLRQAVFACLTCNPAPSTEYQPPSLDCFENAAGICYACSVQCHGDHNLVELFNKRSFSCDCGTERFPAESPCCLRLNPNTNSKGVNSEMPDQSNKYNQNFHNRFCGCALEYDPFQQEGTMFQCLGLGSIESGGCGEDWWHPGCVVGVGYKWIEDKKKKAKAFAKFEAKAEKTTAIDAPDTLPSISEDGEDRPQSVSRSTRLDGDGCTGNADVAEAGEPPMPPGFPREGDFEGFICYKCVDAHPWIRQYAGSPGFLPAVIHCIETDQAPTLGTEKLESVPKKRKATDDAMGDNKRARPAEHAHETDGPQETQKQEASIGPAASSATSHSTSPAADCKRKALPPPPPERFSLFFTEGFRDKLCRCTGCFPLLVPHPQLLEEEETYEPPISEDSGSENEGAGAGSGSHKSGSLYERGESALRNVDRVRAIEGLMAYNHLKDKLKPFFQQFAESGHAISAEDIKSYFAKLRGDEQAIREAGEAAGSDDNRREQSGY